MAHLITAARPPASDTALPEQDVDDVSEKDAFTRRKIPNAQSLHFRSYQNSIKTGITLYLVGDRTLSSKK